MEHVERMLCLWQPCRLSLYCRTKERRRPENLLLLLHVERKCCGGPILPAVELAMCNSWCET